MRKSLFALVVFVWLSLLTIACSDGENTHLPPKTFSKEILLPITPVKNQPDEKLGWLYAMLATIETERLAQGDSVSLSPLYAVRQLLLELTSERFSISPDKRSISLEGTPSMLLHLLHNYGMVGFDAYRVPEGLDFKALCRRLEMLADAGSAHRDKPENINRKALDIIDNSLGTPPRKVFLYGCEYTTHEFAHSICLPDDYQAITSFSNHKFFETFPLEIEENHYGDSFFNLPIDSMISRIDNSLKTGHPVCWQGKITENDFSFKSGYAVTDDEHHAVTQAERNRLLVNRQTRDYHSMAIIGIAHDETGHKFYICKNSWGTDNRFGGLMYLSENFVRANTVAVLCRAV